MNVANQAAPTSYSNSHANRSAPAFVTALQSTSRWLDLLYSPFALATRLYVSWVFLHSGWLKISSWDQTLSLFEDEYRVPLLAPHVAAAVGSFGELFFPILVILGLAGRLGAVGLFAVNALAVISYAHVLFQEGFEAAIGQHYLWGFMLLTLAIKGPGAFSLDRVLARHYRADQW
jgi:putative oxidoreductase